MGLDLLFAISVLGCNAQLLVKLRSWLDDGSLHLECSFEVFLRHDFASCCFHLQLVAIVGREGRCLVFDGADVEECSCECIVLSCVANLDLALAPCHDDFL